MRTKVWKKRRVAIKQRQAARAVAVAVFAFGWWTLPATPQWVRVGYLATNRQVYGDGMASILGFAIIAIAALGFIVVGYIAHLDRASWR